MFGASIKEIFKWLSSAIDIFVGSSGSITVLLLDFGAHCFVNKLMKILDRRFFENLLSVCEIGLEFLELFKQIFSFILERMLSRFINEYGTSLKTEEDRRKYDLHIKNIIKISLKEAIKYSTEYTQRYNTYHFDETNLKKILDERDLTCKPAFKSGILTGTETAKESDRFFREVEARIYSMKFWGNGFRHENVDFIPLEGWMNLYEKGQKENVHYQTGLVKIRIPEEITDPIKAIEYSEKLMEDYSRLLSFALGHDVFFHEFTCNKITHSKTEQETKRLSSISIGVVRGIGGTIHPLSVAKFLEEAIPIIRSKDTVDKTGILRAINLFNAAINSKYMETKYFLLWSSLEILANAHAKVDDSDYIFSEKEWKELDVENEFKDFVKDILKISDPSKRGRLYGKVRSLRRTSISDSISKLLENHGLGQYKSETDKLREIRNDLVHGNNISYTELPYACRKLTKLLGKLILKILNFYEDALVHSSIKRDNLLARS